ncbi:hypothetical protein [Streptosporangium subroseum]|uniref:hypothetical protein n=1 Tax=Streptosporangium subroseum TaxID=106412 RepID=UPI003F4E2DE4
MMFRVDREALAKDGQLKLSGFDYEVSAEVTRELQTGEADVVLVSGRLLAEITRALPAQPVEFVVEGAKAVVTCGSARFTLLTMPVEDYPSLPAMPPAAGRIGSDVFAMIPGKTLAEDEAQAVEVLAVDFEGDDINIAFNHQFLLETT